VPRDLADVLHYFLPDADDAQATSAPKRVATAPTDSPLPPIRQSAEPSSLPILGLPIGDRDVVRAALAWNLAIETARLGGSTVMIAPASNEGSPLWPEPGIGPLGTELVLCPATDLEGLYRAATERAQARARENQRGGIVFVRIPPQWLVADDAQPSQVDWILLLTSANRRDLHEAHALAKTTLSAHPHVDIGVTIHGVSSITEARGAFEYLSRISKEQLGLDLASYGLLVDDLHVYRAIAAQRPIGVAHPQAPATRALIDVAQMLFDDAQSRFHG
jgi:hypothetical protein